MRRPFMNTPEQLESPDGGQYLVLRPASGVADRFVSEQNAALALVGLPHPYTGHVTLRGFYEPTRREELTALIRSWASAQRPIEIIGEAVDAFPEIWAVDQSARQATIRRRHPTTGEWSGIVAPCGPFDPGSPGYAPSESSRSRGARQCTRLPSA
ncbi:hypothetical protein [Microbacterium sp. 1P06AB]|uniref:hypothetical protein n=1 Tax=Microbacterium sp. 1P06AB TaxID=3132289 RepID=UPI0039A4B822